MGFFVPCSVIGKLLILPLAVPQGEFVPCTAQWEKTEKDDFYPGNMPLNSEQTIYVPMFSVFSWCFHGYHIAEQKIGAN